MLEIHVTVQDETGLARRLQAELISAFRRAGYSVDIAGLRLIGGGRSAVTALADVVVGGVQRRVVVRGQIPGRLGIAVGTLRDQYALLEHVRSLSLGAPVPVLLALASDESRTLDLLVVEYIEGEVPDPWRADGRARMAQLRASRMFKGDFIEGLAQIHAVSPVTLPPPLDREGESAAASHSSRLIHRGVAAADATVAYRTDPVLTYATEWLHSYRPKESYASGLVHGDYRMGNLVVRDDRLVGVLDWELSEAGEVLSDVAWLCGPQARTSGFAAGLFAVDELVDSYIAVSGQDIDSTVLNFHSVEGTYRTASIWVRLSNPLVDDVGSVDIGSVRALLSVLQMKPLLAEVLWPGWHDTDGSGRLLAMTSESDKRSRRRLERGIAQLAHLVEEPLHDRAASVAEHQLAVRNAEVFRRRLSELLESGEYAAYTARVRQLTRVLGEGSGASDHPHEPGPGTRLSLLVRTTFAAEGPSVHEVNEPIFTELRALVRCASRPAVAFGDLVMALAIEGSNG